MNSPLKSAHHSSFGCSGRDSAVPLRFVATRTPPLDQAMRSRTAWTVLIAGQRRSGYFAAAARESSARPSSDTPASSARSAPRSAAAADSRADRAADSDRSAPAPHDPCSGRKSCSRSSGKSRIPCTARPSSRRPTAGRRIEDAHPRCDTPSTAWPAPFEGAKCHLCLRNGVLPLSRVSTPNAPPNCGAATARPASRSRCASRSLSTHFIHLRSRTITPSSRDPRGFHDGSTVRAIQRFDLSETTGKVCLSVTHR